MGLTLEKILKALKKPLRMWNKEVFRHIELKIKSFQEGFKDNKAQD